jgi:hypothetical protein
MPSLAVATADALYGAGRVLVGTLGSAEPTNTVVGSVFTDDWSVLSGWTLVGATRDGFEWNAQLSTTDLEVAESIDRWLTVVTGRQAGASFDMAYINLANLAIAMNGGTTTTVSGTTTTTLTSYAPPAPSAIVRKMIGWESEDSTVRWIGYQALQVGNVTFAPKKANYASLPTTWNLEIPAAGGAVWKKYTAGVGRVT